MTLERRAWLVARLITILLLLVSLRGAYWQLIRGWSLQPVVLDPVSAAKTYAQLRGEPTPAPGSLQEAQAAQRGNLSNLPQPVIQRTVEMLSSITRGKIYDRNGTVLAQDVETENGKVRQYSDISLAQTIGYVSALRTGVSGLEATYNDDLLGLNRADTQIDRLLHRPIQGSSLVLTIDENVQQAAWGALGGRPGAAVAIDGKTGAVLALVSAPTYDPNQVQDPNYLVSLGAGALINRAMQGMYTPGSIWKTVTLIASLDTGQVNENTVFDFGKPEMGANGKPYYVYNVGGGQIIDPNHTESKLNLELSYVHSANAAFAKIGNDMNPNVLIDYASRLGFSSPDYTRRFPMELPVAEPQLANNIDDIRSNALLRASTAYGQGELLATPIDMAMVVESVVNNGSIPVPYFVQQVKDPQGNVIQTRPSNHVVRGIMKAKTAQTVQKFMISMVSFFWKDTLVPGATVGGKTGTAQLGGNEAPHGWFIGFVQKGDRTIVIAVVMENAGSGAANAVPVFAEIGKAALAEP